jgi:hypothetical protein
MAANRSVPIPRWEANVAPFGRAAAAQAIRMTAPAECLLHEGFNPRMRIAGGEPVRTVPKASGGTESARHPMGLSPAEGDRAPCDGNDLHQCACVIPNRRQQSTLSRPRTDWSGWIEWANGLIDAAIADHHQLMTDILVDLVTEERKRYEEKLGELRADIAVLRGIVSGEVHALPSKGENDAA